MHKIILILLFQVAVLQSFGQPLSRYYPPLTIPIYLSGNFGEIRSDHFHSGIDIKTQGTTGHHVSTIESGYISRIKVQANGYGRSVYLAHPDGHTSVYGHLDRYREDIEKYVKGIQYRRQSHRVDIYLKPEEFPLEKGDFIAYSGNSGGSMGPHLHFEIRNSANQHPLNVLQYGFEIEDRIAPRFHKLYIYPLGHGSFVNGKAEKHSFELVYDQGVYTVPWGTSIKVSGRIGIGVEVYDYLNGAGNRCGIFSLEGYRDEQLFYQHEMDEFSFSETRYINAHIDYGEIMSSGRKPHRLYRLPNDQLRIYRKLENEGILEINEAGSRSIKVVAADVAGNSSELSFSLTGKAGIKEPSIPGKEDSRVIKFNEASIYEEEGMRVEIAAKSLYEDIEFTYLKTPPTNGFLSPAYHIHSIKTPLHKSFTLSVPAPEVEPELRNKLIFVSYDPEEEKFVSAGGKYIKGRLTASLDCFGVYSVSLDTLPPEIIPLNGSRASNQSDRKSLRYIIRDDLSDIEKYEGYINNRWALFEYDPKNDLLTYTFDKEKLSRNQEHELELYVSDSQGNVNLYHTIFTW
ncbi:MAG: M23 family metallopeptidase [Bacteroidetes bacterium]|nr:M23 family metallopeptidase [Bacteroidota bacterium]